MSKVLFGMIALVFVLSTLGAMAVYLSQRVLVQKETEDFQKAQLYLENDQPYKALQAIQRYVDSMAVQKPEKQDWVLLAAKTFQSTADSASLTALYEKFPRIAYEEEPIAFFIAKGLLADRQMDNYHRLRKFWYPQSEKTHVWFVLDADALLVEGKHKEARALLESEEFAGEKDTGRLLRLALLEAKSNLKGAWDLLHQAQKQDPQNTEIRSYRAQILETIQKPTLARMEYARSLQNDPDNPALYDQLAEFYRRNSHYQQALETWKEALSLPHSDLEWLKFSFWTRMSYPIEANRNAKPPEDEKLTLLVHFIRSLPKGRFWDEAGFEEIPHYPKFLRTRQETFWLRLAEALLEGNEKRATELLDFNIFHPVSWNPELEKTLKQVLSYRKSGVLHIDEVAANDERFTFSIKEQAEHPFFHALAKAAQHSLAGMPSRDVPEKLHALLVSDYAFAAAFLAAGWFEAALTFPLPAALPAAFPDWVAFAYTQALRFARTPLEALQFATKQAKSPGLDLLIGELMLASGSGQAGINHLKPLAKEASEIGMRAAWLISMIQLQQKEYNAARTTVQAHPNLAENIVGKEALARIALRQGDIVRADQFYEEIEDRSLEAKLYLARRAFANQKYKKALALTEELLLYFPENPHLHQDLQKLRKLLQKEEEPQ